MDFELHMLNASFSRYGDYVNCAGAASNLNNRYCQPAALMHEYSINKVAFRSATNLAIQHMTPIKGQYLHMTHP